MFRNKNARKISLDVSTVRRLDAQLRAAAAGGGGSVTCPTIMQTQCPSCHPRGGCYPTMEDVCG